MLNYALTMTLKPHAVAGKPNVRSENKPYLVIDINQNTNKVLFINDINGIDYCDTHDIIITDLLTFKEADKIIEKGMAEYIKSEVKVPEMFVHKVAEAIKDMDKKETPKEKADVKKASPQANKG